MTKSNKKSVSNDEQLITGDVWAQANKHFKKNEKKTACIAYVTSNALALSKGDTLICDASDYEIKFGSTSAKTLDFYFRKGVEIYSNPALHAKLLVGDIKLVIGSANLSERSANTLVESAVIIYNDVLVSQAKAFCYNLLTEKDSVLLSRDHIDRLLKIKVVRRNVKPVPKTSVRKKSFGNKYWYIKLFEMSDREYNRVKDKIEVSEQKVIAKQEVNPDDISSAFFKKVSSFSSSVKMGDQILINWQNNAKTRRYIYPFATVLSVDRNESETVLVYENSGVDYRYTLSQFTTFIKALDLKKPFGLPRGKQVLKEDAVTLKKNWKK